MNTESKPLLGFIGQGFIGKNYSDEFESRGYVVIRYALEPKYQENKDKIKDCDIVFIAVPTPTTPNGFDFSIVRSVLSLVGEGKIAVIKSTILPGTTETLQNEFPNITVFHSPEFLKEATAREDAQKPDRNIVGVPNMSSENIEKAKLVLSVLPKAPYEKIAPVREAELVKYLGNSFLTTKVIFINMAYDVAQKLGADWNTVAEMFSHDPRVGTSHLQPVHFSGRGAGGHCFIKDIEAYKRLYVDLVGDDLGNEVLESLVEKNKKLLIDSGKDLDLLKGVYGDSVM
jgi:UDPglucose 6-dehydrogenase